MRSEPRREWGDLLMFNWRPGRVARLAVAVLGLGLALPGAAAAATVIDFGDGHADPYGEDGFVFAPARIANGNCLSAGGCLALNDNETTTLSRSPEQARFSLTGMSFSLIGNGTGNALTVTGSNGASFSYAVGAGFAKNSYHALLFPTEFVGVHSVTFSTTDGGNVRIDDLAVAPIPLPAAAWLALSGFAALGATRLRRRPRS
jgi:hypothetical protein